MRSQEVIELFDATNSRDALSGGGGGGGGPSSRGMGVTADSVAPRAHSIADFKLLRPLSSGGVGQVWLARKKRTGDFFALKVSVQPSRPSNHLCP